MWRKASTLAFTISLFILAFDYSFPQFWPALSLRVFAPFVDQWQWQPKSTPEILMSLPTWKGELRWISLQQIILLVRPFLHWRDCTLFFILFFFGLADVQLSDDLSTAVPINVWVATNPSPHEYRTSWRHIWRGQWTGRERPGRSSQLPLDCTWASAELPQMAPHRILRNALRMAYLESG